MHCIAVIPARFGSSRLPGKPLADILGKPMIQHVYERVRSLDELADVVVATDDERIVAAVNAFGGKALLTSPHHPSGTDRLREVMQHHPADLYLNVQGDEPLVNPTHLRSLLQAMLAAPQVQAGTLCHAITAGEAENPNTVKVVRNRAGDALYFSRARIPFERESSGKARYFKHIGVYAYRAELLAAFPGLPPSELEGAEMLEQLRIMDAGWQIRVIEVDHAAPGVDTPACLERVRALMSGLPDPALKTGSLADVKLVITDIDGVLTDGGIWYDDSGECLKRFHVRDGMGIKMLQEAGVNVAVISGRDSATLRRRLADLGITVFQLGAKDKAGACRAIMEQFQVGPEATAMIGDDSIDLPGFAACAWPVAVDDAPDYVKRHARVVLTKAGGQGAFREFSDSVLNAQNRSAIYDSVAGYAQAMSRMAQ
ncbi:3-deoxy-manno-octulosonate cytidylyltransferase [Herbaspirillum rubrisubalbicans]|uniref:3-deoxy-manno-octulosonate cytidylyltransferase n=1 Tax=Herbaspirillum rubrisubalbicans TaxID=80842 RepID=A0AAD0XGV2_9BURK|nr:3-deoxy-manno-octulosonate cytidylyltransferase [Herbaspirillum rubrisubalbicans]ALU89088.1 3-deoxy-manno-octulosonate cytidylyltransferase protein [Herbaspirillum rubrisubalbicans M1]AYR24109.1 3-deoxy-manno-octulosonate cytidylyltransferase [Herbaspirillum rubrisubalbicans]